MGNQCTSRCPISSTNTNQQPLNQGFTSTNLHQTIFQSHKAITDSHSIAYPLSTNGISIVDGFDRRVKLCFVTLKGCESNRFCLDGLEDQDLEDMCQRIQQLEFNGVKILYSVELVHKNPIVMERFLGNNEELYHKHALNVLDVVVNRITKTGLMVVLSNYSSSSKTSLSTSDGEGLWWSDKYPEYQWLDTHKHLVQRYAHNPRVIGFELRTHIRGTSRTIPTWGDGNMLTDWRRAAKACANEIQAINRNCLIFIGGLNYGCDLKPVEKHILNDITNLRKIVYTGSFMTQHWNVLSWRIHKYQYFVQQMEELLVCIQKRGHPLWISQFLYQQPIPWEFIVEYLRETDIDWCFSSLNTFNLRRKSNISREQILNVVHELKSIQESSSGNEEQQIQYATATLPAHMISSNQVDIIRHQNAYNVDELLDSTPGESLDEIRQQHVQPQLTERRRQIYICGNEVIEKVYDIPKERNH